MCDAATGRCNCAGDDACAAYSGLAGSACGRDGRCGFRCGRDIECPCGAVCRDGACAPGCVGDGDCCGNGVCRGGRCTSAPGTTLGSRCIVNEGCPDGTFCSPAARGQCLPPAAVRGCGPGSCPTGTVCLPRYLRDGSWAAACLEPCTPGTAACREGFICRPQPTDPTRGACTPRCDLVGCAAGLACDRDTGFCRCADDAACSAAWGPNGACDATRRICLCRPQCDGRQCGADGCGGICGTCGPGTACGGDGRCGAPFCGAGNYVVGPCDGGSYCPNNSVCDGNGTCTCNPGYVVERCGADHWWCVRGCAPQCGGRQCGSDGCGGSCGSCGGGQTCDAAGRCVTPSTNTCAAYASCASCTPNAGCGWCDGTAQCLPGSAAGPSSGACRDWQWTPTQCRGGTTYSCAGRQCGPDSCGAGSCGACASGQTCVGGLCTASGTGGGTAGCTDLTGCVTATQSRPTGAGHCAGEIVLYLTNNCGRRVRYGAAVRDGGALYAESGGTIAPGQRIGGELGGLWSCSRSASASWIYAAAADTDPRSCITLR